MSPPIVLVVDDQPNVAEAYELFLPDEYETRVATGGEAALELMDADVDVVLLDRRMPQVTGDEVLERIRDAGYDARVAMVTAVDPDLDVLELGFDDYLVKPVDRETFQRTLERLLARSAYGDELRAYYAAVSKLAVLEAHKSGEELAASAAYDDLRERARERGERADELLEELLSDTAANAQGFRGLLEAATQ